MQAALFPDRGRTLARPGWRRLAALCLAASCLGPVQSQTSDTLPEAPDYRGEIRRGPDGQLIVVPPQPEMAAPAPSPEDAKRRIIRVGSGEKVTTVSEAARLARDGDIVEIMSGEYRRQPAIWSQNDLVIRGRGHPLMIADGASAEGKAIWVVRGGAIRIEDIEFRGARVADGNGAGIRFEKGRLSLARCGFFDNEMGVLTANQPDMTLEIRDSEFGQAPKHAGLLHHLLYVGKIGKFTLVGSRFQQGYRGHLVKSRARASHVLYNLLYDGPQGQASYELEFPDGGLAYVIGNVIGQSDKTDNPALVAYGAEGNGWPENALYLAHNTLINDHYAGSFLKTWLDKLPEGAEIWAINNLTVGYGTLDPPARGRFEGNQKVSRAALVDYGGIPLKLTLSSPLRGTARPPGSARNVELMPAAEFTFPLGSRPIHLQSGLTPGAFQ